MAGVTISRVAELRQAIPAAQRCERIAELEEQCAALIAERDEARAEVVSLKARVEFAARSEPSTGIEDLTVTTRPKTKGY